MKARATWPIPILPVALAVALAGSLRVLAQDAPPARFEAWEETQALASEAEVRSIAADEDRGVVYFADADVTYALAEGRVVSIFPLGGSLAFADGVLTIASPATRQVVQVDRAGDLVSRVLDATSEEE